MTAKSEDKISMSHKGGMKRAWCGFEHPKEPTGRGWKRKMRKKPFLPGTVGTREGTADFQSGKGVEKGMKERGRANWEHKYEELETF